MNKPEVWIFLGVVLIILAVAAFGYYMGYWEQPSG